MTRRNIVVRLRRRRQAGWAAFGVLHFAVIRHKDWAVLRANFQGGDSQSKLKRMEGKWADEINRSGVRLNTHQSSHHLEGCVSTCRSPMRYTRTRGSCSSHFPGVHLGCYVQVLITKSRSCRPVAIDVVLQRRAKRQSSLNHTKR